MGKLMSKLQCLGLASYFIVASLSSHAVTYPLPKEGDLIGEIQYVKLKTRETLVSLGRQYHIGLEHMKLANPDLPLEKKLLIGTQVVIPSQFILPPGEREGIVVNLPEQRMYFFPKDKNVVMTEPVGIGREGKWQTPTGQAKVVAKETDPKWRPTANVRAEAAKYGTPIPRTFPPGPDNPLGKYILRLNWPTYLIHGTNRPEEVGSRVSAGCIRLLPDAIEALYDEVNVGTPVRILDKPYKVGWKNNHLYIEVHPPLQEKVLDFSEDRPLIMNLIHEKILDNQSWVSWQVVEKAIKQTNGIPFIIGKHT